MCGVERAGRGRLLLCSCGHIEKMKGGRVRLILWKELVLLGCEILEMLF